MDMNYDENAYRQLREKLRKQMVEPLAKAREVWSTHDDQLFTLAYHAWLASGGPDER